MFGTRLLHGMLVLALCGLCLTAGAVTAAPPARAQQCVGAGTDIAPVPWSQRMLAPHRVWPLATGAGQRVAVIGTGVADSPRLRDRVVARTNLAVQETESDTTDCLGIGTGVAGIVAATETDTTGFHGVAPDARLLSAKVVGDSFASGAGQSVPPDRLASAVDWTVERGATVIAVTTVAYQDSPTLRQAVRRAQDRDVVVVAATGEVEKATPAVLTPYPAAYDGVLGVSGIGRDGTVTDASRSAHVDLVAPGYEVVTNYPGNGLGVASGSAFAAGYVAGSAALVRSHRPQEPAEQVVRRLLATATPAPEGVGSQTYGHGVVNPYQAAVETLVDGEPRPLPPMTRTEPDAAELARARAQQRSDTLAFALSAGGAALAAALVALVAFGPRGRRRGWRSGLAELPKDRPTDDVPEPPVELFGDRPTDSSRRR